MLLFLTLACVGGGDSGEKLEDTFPFDTSADSDGNDTDTGDTSDTSDTEDTVPVTDEYGCPTWFGVKPDRVWTFWPRSAATDTEFDISTWIEGFNEADASFTWWYVRDTTIDAIYNERISTNYQMKCDPTDGVVRLGGTTEVYINDNGVESTTVAVFTYDPPYVAMPLDFGARARWDVDVVIDQTVDGIHEVVENNLRYEADLEETVELPYGELTAIAVRLNDVASGNTIGTEYYVDGVGMVADDFSLMANYTP